MKDILELLLGLIGVFIGGSTCMFVASFIVDLITKGA